jgi:RNA polymerase sigma factor (sigma-70 family)
LEGPGQFRGQTDAEYGAWLRTILARTVCNAARDNRRQRNDAGRERAIEARLHESSQFLDSWLAAVNPSPSEQLGRVELMEKVAEAIAELPEAQRAAVALRHWQGLSLKEIAERMEKTPGAVALLIHRASPRCASGCGRTVRGDPVAHSASRTTWIAFTQGFPERRTKSMSRRPSFTSTSNDRTWAVSFPAVEGPEGFQDRLAFDADVEQARFGIRVLPGHGEV